MHPPPPPDPLSPMQRASVFVNLAAEAATRAKTATCKEAVLDGFRSTRFFIEKAEAILQGKPPGNESGTNTD